MTGKLRRILSYPARLRRTKGFGVHSPFAYEFITEVVRPQKGYAYYAYDEIDRVCRGVYQGKKEGRYARLLFRVLCRYNPAEVVLNGDFTDAISFVIGEAARFRDCHSGSLINRAVIAGGSHHSVDFHRTCEWMHGYLTEGECVVVVTQMVDYEYQRRLWEWIEAASYPGMGFTDGNIGIFVARRGLPHLIYDVVI